MSVLPGPCHPRLKKESSEEEPMQTDMGESPYIPGPGENPLYTAEPLTLDDLKLLSDLFYLPYEHGTTARTMLQELDWLKNQSQAAAAETDKVVFIFICKRRSFFYMLSSYSCFLFFFRQQSGAQEPSSSITCVRQWCRCSTACQMPRTAASCTICTTTSVTSRVGSVWLEPT